MSSSINFTQEDWEAMTANWTAWWAGELDRPLVIMEGSQSSTGQRLPEVPRFTCGFPRGTSVEEMLDLYEAQLAAKRFYGDAWPAWQPNYGPGIVAGFLGAEVHCTKDTVWFGPAQETPIHDLTPTYRADNPWWERVQELTRAAVERWGDRVAVGQTDLGGNLDILASLLGTQRLLLDLCEAPQEVARLTREVTQLWLRYYDELHAIIREADRGTNCWAAIYSPRRCYMLQSDFSYMISPQMFEQFVLPDVVACCEALDHCFYHLDGKGQISHLDILLSLEQLDGVQWIPGAGMPRPEEWLPLLKRIRDAGKLCQLYVTPQGARTIIRELGGRGFAFCIVDGIDEQGFYARKAMSPTAAKDLMDTLIAENTGVARN
jgi:5-methyltetrahydrofolate--homocysteine methyltransferase